MSKFRRETDLLGELKVPANALYGIHTVRALTNFPIAKRPVNKQLAHAFGMVKLACAQTNFELGFLSREIFDSIQAACQELIEGKLDHWIVVDALQGGAGTSTNMNINEVIANRALQLIGKTPGEYSIIHPIDQVNLHQSTNDTYPTALRVAAITLLHELEARVVKLHEAFQEKEKEFSGVVKIGRTELQDAVLITLGREMSAYAEALTRDRWRIYKCEERLRVVNLGGGAIGTGATIPRQFIFKAIENLRSITGFGLARAENLVEATQNADVFVEVSGILKACASSLFKIANDLRLLSSGPEAGLSEIILPELQAGSSIMPGKVNPVIPEAVQQAAMLVMGNDSVITQAAANGNLELNSFLPLIAEMLLESIEVLSNTTLVFREQCVQGIKVNEERCDGNIFATTAVITALLPTLGYKKADEIAKKAREQKMSIREIVVGEGILTEEEFRQLISPEAVCRLGIKT